MRQELKTAKGWKVPYNIMAIFLLLCSVACGATYYVDPDTGDNGNDGSIGSPWATFKYAVSSSSGVTAGDTVYLREGIYYEGGYSLPNGSEHTIGISGTSGNPITISGYTGETAVLDGSAALTGWTQCTTGEQLYATYGNANYANIYYKDLLKSSYPEDGFYLFWEGKFCVKASNPDLEYHVIETSHDFEPVSVATQGQRQYIYDTNYVEIDDFWNGATATIRLSNAGNYNYNYEIVDWVQGENKFVLETAMQTDADDDDGWCLRNHPALIDDVNEFAYWDHPTDPLYARVYLYPPMPAELDTKARVSDKSHAFLIWANYLTIKDLELRAYAKWMSAKDDSQTQAIGGTTPWNSNWITIQDVYIHDCHGGGVELNTSNSLYLRVDVNDIAEHRGMSMLSGENNRVSYCNIQRSRSSSIYFAGCVNSIIDHCQVGVQGTHGNGISIYQGCDTVLVAHNRVLTNNIAMTYKGSANLYVFGNVLISIQGTSGYCFADWQPNEESWFLHNTFVNWDSELNTPTQNALGSDTGYRGHVNNIFNGYTGIGYHYPNITGHQYFPDGADRYNLYTKSIYNYTEGPIHWRGPYSGDIENYNITDIFTDPAKYDLTLKVGSPAIDAGTPNVDEYIPSTQFPAYDFSVDIAGNTWGEVRSMGAYDPQTGSTLPAGTRPTIVSNGGGEWATIEVEQLTTAVTTVVATGDATISYSLTGGDTSLFQIDSSTGVLSFISGVAYDPDQTQWDQAKIIEVTATNGSGSDNQTIHVVIIPDTSPPIPSVTRTNTTSPVAEIEDGIYEFSIYADSGGGNLDRCVWSLTGYQTHTETDTTITGTSGTSTFDYDFVEGSYILTATVYNENEYSGVVNWAITVNDSTVTSPIKYLIITRTP